MARIWSVAGLWCAAAGAFLMVGAARAADGVDQAPAPASATVAGECGCQPDGAASRTGGGQSGCACCNQQSSWVATGGFVFLQRANLDHTIELQPAGGNNTSAAVRASDFDFDFRSGLDVSLTRNFGDDYGPFSAVQLRFLGALDWSDSFSTNLPHGDNVPFAAPQPFGNGAAQFWQLNYRSNLQSFELNLPHPLCSGLTGLVGIRWLQIDERLSMNADSPSIPQIADFAFPTGNNLIGFQFGLQADSGPCWGRWKIDGVAKAGAYSNMARNSFNLTVITGGASIPTFTDSTDKLAFVGELGFGLSYLFSDHLTARVGYELLYVDGVATAGDQIPALNLTTRSGIDASGFAKYEGISGGVTWSF